MKLLLASLLLFLFCSISRVWSYEIPKSTSFRSGGKPITVEWFAPQVGPGAQTKKLPVVVILHGCGGLDDSGGFFRDLAIAIAKHGRAAAIVHYMDRNGLKQMNSGFGHYFGGWLATIGDSLSYIEKQPFADSNNMSLLGHSLGAQLALQLAAKDKRVESIVDMAGCFVLPTNKVTRMPPVLILHGKADTIVPLAREKALVSVLKRVGSKYEEHIFPKGDHVFNNVGFDELVGYTNQFLDRHNQPPPAN